MGQGEYIAFHKLPNGEKEELSRDTFEQVYKILNHYSPAAIINRGSDKAAEECSYRYELIKTKIKEIDSTLEVVFIPRTLYELIFIRKCIKEDLKHGNICSFLEPSDHKPSRLRHLNGDQDQIKKYLEAESLEKAQRKCWHLAYFEDAGDNEDQNVKDVAFRLNKVIIKTLSPSSEGFTYQEISILAEKEIQFLKKYREKCSENFEKRKNDKNVHLIFSTSTPGPTTNFGYDFSCIKTMSIQNDTDAQLVRNAIALDCSKIAQHSFFLYRGSKFEKDSVVSLEDKDIAYSDSFGTSLFAGCIYDPGATAMYYMLNKKNDAYAISVPFTQLHLSPFYIPPTNTVAQLFGYGETFHSRTKAWKDFDLKKIDGINCAANHDKRDHLKSDLSKDEFIAQFQSYKNRAIQLK